MQFKQADILSGLDKGLIARLMAIGTKSTYDEGTQLFSQGDPAQYFYILVKGCIRLSLTPNNSSNYMVNHGGEAFGWSALTGRKEYSASATCVAPSTLMAFDHNKIDKILSEDPGNALIFYKNLLLTLGNRLLLASSQLTDHLGVEDNISYGTGQVQEAVELI